MSIEDEVKKSPKNKRKGRNLYYLCPNNNGYNLISFHMMYFCFSNNDLSFLKKFVLSILFVCFAIITNAQHLNFLGIPIDGNINDFQNKLASKGIKVNRAASKEAPVGQRVFNGKFKGYNSDIIVFYSRKTKNVYKVSVATYSNKQDVIQKLLDTSLDNIEKNYVYASEHDIDDMTRAHFKYFIYPSNESNNYIGIIHLEPSYTVNLPENASRFEIDGFMITYTYEDAINTSSLTPSTTEPHASKRYSCGEPDNFYKFLSWGNNFRKHECFDRSIEYYLWVLDYFKYGCASERLQHYEEELDNTIMYMQSCLIGRIKTAYNNEYASVYRVRDYYTKRFKCIEYHVNSATYHIKLDANDIRQQINALTQLKQAYNKRKATFATNRIRDYATEAIDFKLPALVGKDRLRDQFGDIEWRRFGLISEFTAYDQELRIKISYFEEFSSYGEEILLFRNEKEIDDYLNFLKQVNIN